MQKSSHNIYLYCDPDRSCCVRSKFPSPLPPSSLLARAAHTSFQSFYCDYTLHCNPPPPTRSVPPPRCPPYADTLYSPRGGELLFTVRKHMHAYHRPHNTPTSSVVTHTVIITTRSYLSSMVPSDNPRVCPSNNASFSLLIFVPELL